MIKVLGNGWAEIVFPWKRDLLSPVTNWCTIGRVIEVGDHKVTVEFWNVDQVLERRVFEVNTDGL